MQEYFHRFPNQKREQSHDERQLEDEEYRDAKRRNQSAAASTSRRAVRVGDDGMMQPVPTAMNKGKQKRARAVSESMLPGIEREEMEGEMELEAGLGAVMRTGTFACWSRVLCTGHGVAKRTS